MSKIKQEFISCEENYEDAWICNCGNTPDADGFYPCNEEGIEVDPTEKEWNGENYACNKCGRIIDQTTLEVIGHKK